MDEIAVLIPCYNEAKTVKKVVEDFHRELPNAAIYVYDNNSTDGTAGIAKEAGAVVRYAYQQGKGNVIRKMFREIDAKVYLMVDGDDTYPAENAKAMIAPVLERDADMVVGDRLSSSYYTENKRPFHNFGNSLVKNSINCLFQTDIKDIMTGYRAFNYRFVKTFPVMSKGFEIETEMSIHAAHKNLYVENVIVDYRDRPEGSVSKLNTFSDGMKVILEIEKLYRTYLPMRYFGLISILLILVAAIFFSPVLITYMETGSVPHFPTLIVCGFTAIAGLMSLFSGLILTSIAKKNRSDFELNYIAAGNRFHDLLKEK